MAAEYRDSIARDLAPLHPLVHRTDRGANLHAQRIVFLLGSAQLCHGTPEASLPLIEQGNGELDHGSNVPYAILPLCFGPQ